jgi:hypothetical protein
VATERSTMRLGIADLLKLRGFDPDEPAKLVRHQDRRCDVNDLVRRGWFDFYQATQGKPLFRHCKRIVSFVGAGGTKARFVGVYTVLEERDGRKIKPPKGYPPALSHYRYYYELERVTGYEDLENRAIVEWGENGAINWHQWLNKKRLNDKVVVELLPAAQTIAPFRDYLDFTLTHRELRQLYDEEDANREWRSRLAAVAGVYLILATKTGKQYVGSAYGAEGIWGRWAAYARNGHGGNKLLKGLIAKDPAYPEAFSYSILQILPKTFARKEVIRSEERYKEKLGSRATGLNT